MLNKVKCQILTLPVVRQESKANKKGSPHSDKPFEVLLYQIQNIDPPRMMW